MKLLCILDRTVLPLTQRHSGVANASEKKNRGEGEGKPGTGGPPTTQIHLRSIVPDLTSRRWLIDASCADCQNFDRCSSAILLTDPLPQSTSRCKKCCVSEQAENGSYNKSLDNTSYRLTIHEIIIRHIDLRQGGHVIVSACLSVCLSVCHCVCHALRAGSLKKVIRRFHWKLVLWLGLPVRRSFGDDSVPDTDSWTLFLFPHHCGIAIFIIIIIIIIIIIEFIAQKIKTRE